MVGLPFVVMIILFNQQILQIFGEDFLEAGPVLIILSLGQLFNAATGPMGSVFIMSGYTGLFLLNTILIFGFNILMDIVLIPRLGIVGAGISKSVVLSLTCLLLTLELYFVLRIWPYNRQFIKPLIAAVVAAVITNLMISASRLSTEWFTLVLGLIVFFTIYIAGLLILGLDKAEILILKILYGRLRMILIRVKRKLTKSE